MNPTIDDRDRVIIARNHAALDRRPGPRVGDWVDFADGKQYRISYIWDFEDGTVREIQTSRGGSWHLGSGYVSFSGGLLLSVKESTLAATEETRSADIWIFHHDLAGAHRAVYMDIPFRVFTCSRAAPRC